MGRKSEFRTFCDTLYPGCRTFLRRQTLESRPDTRVVVCDFLTSLASFTPDLKYETQTSTLGWDLFQSVVQYINQWFAVADTVVLVVDKSEYVVMGKGVTQEKRRQASTVNLDHVVDTMRESESRAELLRDAARKIREDAESGTRSNSEREERRVNSLLVDAAKADRAVARKEMQIDAEQKRRQMREDLAARVAEGHEVFADHLPVPLPWCDAPRVYRPELMRYLTRRLVLNYRPVRGKTLIIDGHYLDVHGMRALLEEQLEQAKYHARRPNHVVVAQRNLDLYVKSYFPEENEENEENRGEGEGPTREENLRTRATPIVIMHSNEAMDPDALRPPAEPRGMVSARVERAFEEYEKRNASSGLDHLLPMDLEVDDLNPFSETRPGGFQRATRDGRRVWENVDRGILFYEEPCAFNSVWAQADWWTNRLGEADHALPFYVQGFWEKWIQEEKGKEKGKEREKERGNQEIPPLSEYEQLLERTRSIAAQEFLLVSTDTDVLRDALFQLLLLDMQSGGDSPSSCSPSSCSPSLWPRVHVVDHVGLSLRSGISGKTLSAGYSTRDVYRLYQCIALDLHSRMSFSATGSVQKNTARYHELLTGYDQEKSTHVLLGDKRWEKELEEQEAKGTGGKGTGGNRASLLEDWRRAPPEHIPEEYRAPEPRWPVGSFLAAVLSVHDYCEPYFHVTQTRFIQAVYRFALYIGDVIVPVARAHSSAALDSSPCIPVTIDGPAYERMVCSAYWMVYHRTSALTVKPTAKQAREGATIQVRLPWDLTRKQLRHSLVEMLLHRKKEWKAHVHDRSYPEDPRERQAFATALDKRMPSSKHIALRALSMLYAVAIVAQIGRAVPLHIQPLAMHAKNPDEPISRFNIVHMSSNVGQWRWGLPE